jgi:hypothetical protein
VDLIDEAGKLKYIFIASLPAVGMLFDASTKGEHSTAKKAKILGIIGFVSTLMIALEVLVIERWFPDTSGSLE